MKIIDLRSDTITLPTDEMRRAMFEAEVGDDVYQEDPTTNRLEEISAKAMGKEAALFTTSGTQSNLIAVLANTRHGDEIILGDQAHMYWNEVGGAAALGGVSIRTVPNDEDGQLDADEVKEAIRPKNIHYPVTTLLCLENTHNRCGGTVLTAAYTASIAKLAHDHELKVHLDGARIFNAAVALGVDASELAGPVDSVCFCISKGLSAPVGSLLCGSTEYIERARKWRKMLGGGMRQIGIIAAAGIISLEKMVNRLAEDHKNAKYLASGLARIPGIGIHPEKVQTNIVMFTPPDVISWSDFNKRMEARGVKLSHGIGKNIRAVTHCMVTVADIDNALELIAALVRELG
ncbi:MAG: low-specificity L-threonine aldolase [Chloroflexota bacterium]